MVPLRLDQLARVVVELTLMVDVAGSPVEVPRYRLRPGSRSDDVACTSWFADLADSDP